MNTRTLSLVKGGHKYVFRYSRGCEDDIMDAITELKVMLRDLRPTENRCYYLDNIMVGYDIEIQLWQQRKWVFWNLNRDFDTKAGLPSAEELGLVLP